MDDVERIAKKLTKAQREAVVDGRWIHPGGMDPIYLVDFNGFPWPQGVAEFFAFRTDRLTPLGMEVRAYLEQNS